MGTDLKDRGAQVESTGGREREAKLDLRLGGGQGDLDSANLGSQAVTVPDPASRLKSDQSEEASD